MTESCSLALIMTFLFLRIFLWIKLLYAVLTAAAYSYCVLYFVTPIYQVSTLFMWCRVITIFKMFEIFFFYNILNNLCKILFLIQRLKIPKMNKLRIFDIH